MASQARSNAVEKERSAALAQMDLTKILRAYVQQMVHEVQGYKALLLDKETMRIVSTLYGRTELADHGVVHVERLDAAAGGEGKEHMELKAVVFVRPTRENVTLLKRELRQPRFQSYHLFFSHLVPQMYLQDLAEADAPKELIQAVQEFYGDFMALDAHHFVVPVAGADLLVNPRAAGQSGMPSEYEVVDRLVQGLSGLFLALRRRPVIRYQRNSEYARRLAESLYSLTYKQQVGVFDFGSHRASPVVLLLDRRDDPVTPLLSQWTYQAMIHELLGIRDGTVILDTSKVPEQYREVVLDASSDDFYARHRHSNYGEVGLAVKEAVEKFSAASAQHRQVNSLEDMRRFVMEHSDFSRAQSVVSKHVNVMSALSEQIAARRLMDVSSIEQELANPAASLSAASTYDTLADLLRKQGASALADKDAVRLVMLYALRFESEGTRVRGLLDLLEASRLRDRKPALMAAAEGFISYGGAERRAGDLYGGGNILLKARNLVKGLQGVDNVYTQHSPLLTNTLGAMKDGSLSTQHYPFMGTTDEQMAWAAAYKTRPPSEAIVFVVGGSTYEEAKAVAEWNAKQGGSGSGSSGPQAPAGLGGAPPAPMRALLGGSGVVNSDAFLAALSAGASSGGFDLR
ncbi:MAG: SM/Sec1-family protein [Monoraphidium minutum]|nr:MAG: SM/Sec1-family protein [Monoraphidium minutum]